MKSQGLGKRFGGFVALDGIDLAVTQGERVGLIGPNGSGKSTLVNCICGTLTNETGTVRFDGEIVNGLLTHERTRRGMARSFQLPRPFATLTVAENLRVPLLYTVNARPRHRRCRRARSMRAAPSCCSWSALEDKAKKLPRDLTQVEMRKLELARAMAAEPKLLIADEAMAGLSHSEVDDIVDAAGPAQRARHHHHPDRAHHARGDEASRSAWSCWSPARRSPTARPDDVIRDPEVERAYLGQ